MFACNKLHSYTLVLYIDLGSDLHRLEVSGIGLDEKKLDSLFNICVIQSFSSAVIVVTINCVVSNTGSIPLIRFVQNYEN